MSTDFNYKPLPSSDPFSFNYDKNYFDQLEEEFSSSVAIPAPSYYYPSEQKTQGVAEQIFSHLLLVAKLPHFLARATILRTTPTYSEEYIDRIRHTVDPQSDDFGWKYKRISVEVHGALIDAMLVMRESTLNNGKWILNSLGHTEIYETHKAEFTDTKQLLLDLDANALIFNYPQIGGSQGFPDRKTLSETYKAMLSFLEDQIAGIGAKTIIPYGYSLGGSVQAEALESHELKSDIDYVFIKSRTFSSLGKVGDGKFWPFGSVIQLLDWGMDTFTSSKKLTVPEIILQSAHVKDAKELRLTDQGLIADDGAFAAESTLAYDLLEAAKKDPFLLENKTIIGIPENHVDLLSKETLKVLAEEIKKALEKLRTQPRKVEEKVPTAPPSASNWEWSFQSIWTAICTAITALIRKLMSVVFGARNQELPLHDTTLQD